MPASSTVRLRFALGAVAAAMVIAVGLLLICGSRDETTRTSVESDGAIEREDAPAGAPTIGAWPSAIATIGVRDIAAMPPEIRGRVVDRETGAAIGGATIHWRAWRQGDESWQCVSSEGDGSFVIPVGEGARAISCMADAGEYAPEQVDWGCAPDRSRDALLTIELTRGGVLRGRVLAADSREPVEGAAIVLARTDVFDRLPPRRAISGRDGSFVLRGADAVINVAGSWREARIEARGYADARIRIPELDGFEGRESEIEDVLLDRAWPLSGRVCDAQGAAVPGAVVGVFGLDGNFSRFRELTTTDVHGRFRVSGVPVTRSATVAVVASFGARMAWCELPASGGPAEDVEIVARPSVSFRIPVRDEEGRPVESARVIAIPCFDPLDRGHGGWFLAEALHAVFVTKTGADGIASWSALPLADGASGYRFKAMRAGFLPDDAFRHVEDSDAHAPLMLRRARNEAIIGHVRDEAGVPIAGARVSIWWEDSAATDSEGNFRVPLQPCPNASEQTLEVFAAGFGRERRRIDIDPDRTLEPVSIILARAADVSGRVVDETGAGISGVRLVLDPGDRDLPDLRCESGRDGSFVFENARLAPQRLRVAYETTETGRWIVPRLDPMVTGGDRTVMVTLRRRRSPIAFRADVRDGATNEPLLLDGAWLAREDDLFIPGELPSLVLAKGQASCDAVPPGTWLVIERTRSGLKASQRFVARYGDREVRVDVKVGERGRILGRVAIDGGALPEKVTASLRGVGQAADAAWSPCSDTHAKAIVEPDGTFRFVDVPPGAVELRVETERLVALQTVVIRAGETCEVETKLVPAATVVVQASLPEDATRPSLALRAGDDAWQWTTNSRSDSTVVPAGPVRWTLGATLPDGSIRVASGETVLRSGDAEVIHLGLSR